MFRKHAPRFLLAALLLSAWLGKPSPAHAAGASDDPPIYNIDFPGGTVEEYVAHLREIVPEANIVLMPDASKVRIPAVKIRVPADYSHAPLELLEKVTAASAEPNVRIDWDGIVRVVRLVEPATPRAAATPYVRSYSLANAIVKGHIGAEDILRNIETSLELAAGSGDLPDLRFHESTSLLMVRGSSIHHNTISNVLGSMRQTADEIRERQAAPPPLFAPPAQDDQRVKEALHELQKMEARHEMFQQLLEEVRELRERLDRLEQKQE